MKVNDISICNTNEISNAFNEHVSTIGPRLAREVPLTSDQESIYLNNITENYNEFCFRPTTTSNVFIHLNRLSWKTKATGLDNISATLIRESADIISGRYAILASLLIQATTAYLNHFRSRQSVREDCVRSVIHLLK